MISWQLGTDCTANCSKDQGPTPQGTASGAGPLQYDLPLLSMINSQLLLDALGMLPRRLRMSEQQTSSLVPLAVAWHGVA